MMYAIVVIATMMSGVMFQTASHSHPGSLGLAADSTRPYTYKKDIAPIIDRYCVSCHSSDETNPSDLYMDDFATLMKGGKHGVPVVSGQPEKSPLYFKLLPDPPFGKQMPRGHTKITPEAIRIIHDWIQQGAKEK